MIGNGPIGIKANQALEPTAFPFQSLSISRFVRAL